MSKIDYLIKLLENIGKTSKRGEKEALIADALASEYGETVYRYMWLTYNPYVRFGFHDVKMANMCHIETDIDSVLEAFIEQFNGDKNYRKIAEQIKPIAGAPYWEILAKMFKGDLDCGIGVSTINKCITKDSGFEKIPKFKVAKAEEVKHLDNMKPPFYGNEKYDGARCFLVVSVENDELSYEMLSGSGRKVNQVSRIIDSFASQVEPIKPAIIEAGGAVFDGEMVGVVHDEHMGAKFIPRQKSNGVFNKMLKGSASPEECEMMTMIAFDCLLVPSYKDIEKDKTPLSERIGRLSDFDPDYSFEQFCSAPYCVLESVDEAHEFADVIIAEGGEGAIVKAMESVYELKRSKNWVKIKATFDVDVEVVGWTEHSKDADMIGALEIATSDGLITGRIGTGKWLTHDRRRELKKLADDGYLTGMILHTKIMEVTIDRNGDKRFYIPRIEEQRHDKSEADSHDKVMDMMR